MEWMRWQAKPTGRQIRAQSALCQAANLDGFRTEAATADQIGRRGAGPWSERVNKTIGRSMYLMYYHYILLLLWTETVKSRKIYRLMEGISNSQVRGELLWNE